jgi:hypothetical protein
MAAFVIGRNITCSGFFIAACPFVAGILLLKQVAFLTLQHSNAFRVKVAPYINTALHWHCFRNTPYRYEPK